MFETLKSYFSISSGEYDKTKFLTGFRAYAALGVMLIHYGGAGLREIGGSFGDRVVDFGKYGVIVFFVLSAFTIMNSIDNTKNFKYLEYIKRRLFRILPLYIVMLYVAVFIVGFVSLSSEKINNFISSIFFLNFFNIDQRNSLIGVEWTISIEVFFYLIIPIIYFYISKKFNIEKITTVVFIGLIISLISIKFLILPYFNSPAQGLSGLYSIERYAFSYACGIALYYFLKRYKTIKASSLSLAILLAILAVFIFIGEGMIWNTFFITIWTILLIIICVGRSKLSRILFENRVVQFFGTISYSIYLTHLLVYYSVPNPENKPLFFLGGFILTTIISTFTYYFIEKPFMILGKNITLNSMLGKIEKFKVIARNDLSKNLPNQKIFWLVITGIFTLTNIADDNFKKLINLLLDTFNLNYSASKIYELMFRPFEKFAFLMLVLTLLFLLYKQLRKSKFTISFLWDKSIFIKSLLLFALVSILIIPFFGTSSLGASYGHFSLDPFSQETGWLYRRILMPAISYYSQLTGEYGYFLIALFFTFILTYLVVYYLIKYSNRKIPTWQILSILTCGTFIFNFQFPGYVEQLIFIMLFLSVIINKTSVRVAFFSLSLITHETAAITILLPIVLFFYPRKELKIYLTILFIYLFTLLLNFKFNLSLLYQTQSQIGDKNSVEWLISNPMNALFSFVFAYKLLWLVPWVYLKQIIHKKREFLFITSALILPIFTIVLGIDATRLISLGSFVIIYCFANLKIEDKRLKYLLYFILILNLIIPSINWGLHGYSLPDGLYNRIVGG